MNRKNWPTAYVSHPERWVLWGVAMAPKASAKYALKDDLKDARVSELTFDYTDRDDPSVHLKARVASNVVRNWLDPVKVKSTLFNITTIGRSIVFKGKGSGHGVGMCQWGAKKMGEKGFSLNQILTTYYPGVKIARIWK